MGANKPIIGLVGQVCAGKSTVAAAFKRRGATVYDADAAVRKIYNLAEAVNEVQQMFGAGVIDIKGAVDRKALAKIVFSDPSKLETLTTQIIFPRTGKAISEEIEKYRASASPLLVLDAPTLFESGRQDVCTQIVFVAAPPERRKEWAKARGWDERELERRESNLANESNKRQRASFIIENSGTVADIEKQVEAVFEKVTAKKA